MPSGRPRVITRYPPAADMAEAPKVGRPPDYMRRAARQVWYRLARQWEIELADRALFELYCEAYIDLQECREVLRGTDTFIRSNSGALEINPWARRVESCEARLLRLMTELGVTTQRSARRESLVEADEEDSAEL